MLQSAIKRINSLFNHEREKTQGNRTKVKRKRDLIQTGKINKIFQKEMSLQLQWCKKNGIFQFSSTATLSKKNKAKVLKHYPNLLLDNEIDDQAVYDFFGYLQQQGVSQKKRLSIEPIRKKIAFYDPQHFENGQILEKYLNHLQTTQSDVWQTKRKELRAAEVIYFPIAKSLSETNSNEQKHWFLIMAVKKKKGKHASYVLKGVDGLNLYGQQQKLFEQAKIVINALYPKRRLQFEPPKHYGLPAQTGAKDCGAVVCFAAALTALGVRGEHVLSELHKVRSESCYYRELRQYCANKIIEFKGHALDKLDLDDLESVEVIDMCSSQDEEENADLFEKDFVHKSNETPQFIELDSLESKLVPKVISLLDFEEDDEVIVLKESSPKPVLISFPEHFKPEVIVIDDVESVFETRLSPRKK